RAPVPFPRRAAARSHAGRRAVPGHLAAGDRGARGLAPGRRVRHLAVPDRAQPARRPLARAPAPPAGACGRGRARGPGHRRRHPRAHAVGVRAAPQPGAGAGRASRRPAPGGAAAPAAGTDPGADRRDHRRGPGNGEIPAALCNGQAARETCPMSREQDPLSPEERELADALARATPRRGPPPQLDATILASARAALKKDAAPPARARRRRWPAALGVAASLALAVGIAWQLRPAPDQDLAPMTEGPPPRP